MHTWEKEIANSKILDFINLTSIRQITLFYQRISNPVEKNIIDLSLIILKIFEISTKIYFVRCWKQYLAGILVPGTYVDDSQGISGMDGQLLCFLGCSDTDVTYKNRCYSPDLPR